MIWTEYQVEDGLLVQADVNWDDSVLADAEPETKRLKPLRLAM